jgi:hypothetical protein
VGWVPLLAQVHDEVLRVSREQGPPLPRQTSSTHRLDRMVIEVTVAILEREGTRIRAVRAVFAEGAPAFPGSFLSEGFHVQVAVRDMDLISNVNLVPAGLVDPAPPPRAAVATTARAVSPVVDPADAGERIRRYFENGEFALVQSLASSVTPTRSRDRLVVGGASTRPAGTRGRR